MIKLTPTLSAQQMRIAVYVLAYLRANDNMPTMAQAAADFGMVPNAIDQHKKALFKKGLLEKTEAKGSYRFARTTRGQALLSAVIARAQDQSVSLATSLRLVEAIEAIETPAKPNTCPATTSVKQATYWLGGTQVA